VSKSALGFVWIDGAPVEFTDGSGLDYNLRQLAIHSLEMLDFAQDDTFDVKVVLTNGAIYEGRMRAGMVTMVARGGVSGTLYALEFTSSAELHEAK